MRGIFFGTSEFAVPSLRSFARAVDCRLVITQPDRPAQRGRRLAPTPVKVVARELGLPVIEPERLGDVLDDVQAVEPDLFAVASYGKIVPPRMLALPRFVALNVHPSLLPRYRGATPLQTQLRDGVLESGVTIIAMDAGMDTGDIVLVERSRIGARETYGELHERFAELGAALLERACSFAAAGTLVRTPQAGLASEAEIARTMTRPLGKGDLVVDWSAPATAIVDLVRSLAPRPGARAALDGEERLVKILEASVSDAPADGDCAVRAGDGRFVVVERLVPADRAMMTGRAFVAGRRTPR